jgi:hypothetical protein
MIQATGGFAASTAVIQLGGAAGSNQHGIRISGLRIDGNAALADYGIYSESINELCKIENCFIYDTDEYGIYIDSTSKYARNFELEGIWIAFPNASGDEVGIYIKGGPSDSGDFTSQRGGSNITVIGDPAPGNNASIGILLENYVGGMWDRIHLEECDDGFYLGGASESCRAVTLQNIHAVNCTDVIEIHNNSNTDAITFLSIFRSGGTNIVNDNLTGKALTLPRLSLYQIGSMYIYGGGFRQSFDLWYQDNVAASQAAVILNRADHAGATPAGYAHRLILGKAGSITALWIRMNANRSAGSLTVEVYKNAGATGLTAVIDGTNPLKVTTEQPIGDDSFSAGDWIDLRITTDGSWAPTTDDLRAGIEIVN